MNDYRKSFHGDLDELRTEVLKLSALTCEVVSRATDILLAGDIEAAAELISDDDVVDEVSVDIDERCFRLLARQAPVATDLRTIVAIMRINSEFERSADLMVNVAKATRRLYGVNIPPRLRGIIQEMSDEARKLMRLATDAFSDSNAPLGDALHDVDDRLDALQGELVQGVFECHAAGLIDVASAVQFAVISRYYERVGDHAVNIGERVMFMADGSLPEHTGAARAKARRAGRANGEPVTSPSAREPTLHSDES